MTAVDKANKLISQKAVQYANQMMRDQFLDPENAPAGLARRLAVLRKRNMDHMMQSWSPFVADARGGLGLRLRDSDALLLSDFGALRLTDEDKGLISLNGEFIITDVAQSMKPSERIKRIAADAITQAIMESPSTQKAFVSSLLFDQVLSDNPMHKADQIID